MKNSAYYYIVLNITKSKYLINISTMSLPELYIYKEGEYFESSIIRDVQVIRGDIVYNIIA